MREGANGLWLVIYMTHRPELLEAAEQLLAGEGFLVRRRAISGANTYELRVLESEAQEARKLLVERGF